MTRGPSGDDGENLFPNDRTRVLEDVNPIRAIVMGKWIHRAFVLATSLVPLAGVLWLGWSASTFLLVFWAETLLSGTANVLRIWLHRRLTRATGHFRRQLDDSSARALGREKPTGEITFLAEYSMLFFVFTIAHGAFLLFFLVILDRNWTGERPSPWQIDGESFRNGVLAVAGITLVELLYDAFGLHKKPFSWLKARVQVALARVLVLHLMVVFGTFLMIRYETPMTFFGILVALKALLDLAASGERVETPPRNPPGWLVALAKKQGIDDMDREWARILAEQKRRAEEDETRRPAE